MKEEKEKKFQMFDFEPPKVKTPQRSDIYGKPGPPLATCNQCKKNYPVSEMQEFYLKPGDSFWLCPRCNFKKRMRAKFNPRI
jgi:hypothetical protein